MTKKALNFALPFLREGFPPRGREAQEGRGLRELFISPGKQREGVHKSLVIRGDVSRQAGTSGTGPCSPPPGAASARHPSHSRSRRPSSHSFHCGAGTGGPGHAFIVIFFKSNTAATKRFLLASNQLAYLGGEIKELWTVSPPPAGPGVGRLGRAPPGAPILPTQGRETPTQFSHVVHGRLESSRGQKEEVLST